MIPRLPDLEFPVKPNPKKHPLQSPKLPKQLQNPPPFEMPSGTFSTCPSQLLFPGTRQPSQNRDRMSYEWPKGRPNALTLSMEEEHLRREISSLNSKLEKVRVSTDSHDEGDDDTKNEPDSRNDGVETLLAYGGGAHHKAGTRTAPVDRCSMEKRMQMSGVHQTRVRKGVQVHVQDDSKADGKKPDKVVVKKDLALKMLLS
ncbi:hypothetical protein DYB37_002499 [Aphanomyces astaci]|uniref:Uncharacterized protein n=1 Tax=Aphanomyces astaci TaxID=112090 RepID=A0A418F6V7_APHAT|nr:hypothetical protein DYB37_002499 [Aphanomyces astaci]